MGVRFAIGGWTACAPGLQTPGDWQEWSRAPTAPRGDFSARLDAMPAMQRRRLNGLGRAAAQVAWDVHAPDPATPVILASRYGDADRCLHLLREFAATGAASPTDFTFSVHNAIGAMYSIARGDTAAYGSIAAGAASAAAGVVEASALLADGAPEVLLVCYHAPLPGEYASFDREPVSAYAWAWRMVAAVEGEPCLSLEWEKLRSEAAHPPEGEELPFGLQVLRFAVSGDSEASMTADGTCWTWRRHA